MSILSTVTLTGRSLPTTIDNRLRGDDQAAIEEGMGRNRGEDQGAERRVDERAAGRERVGRRPGRRRHDQPVGAVGEEMLAIDRDHRDG